MCVSTCVRAATSPEPEVLPLAAETRREAPKCCAWQHQGGGPETRSGTVQSLKRCPCQQKRVARLPSAAPGSIKEGGPETRSGTVQSLKRCPCQQKRAASQGRPETRSGTVQSLKCCPCQQKRAASREAPKCCAWQHQGGGAPKRAREPSEPQVLPLPAETSREAPKCQHQKGPKRARAPSRA